MPVPRPARPLRWALGLVAALAVAGTSAVALAPSDDAVFAAGRAFSEPVPEDPRLDPASDAIAALLGEPWLALTLNTGEYGQPVYEADADTPLHQVEVTRVGTDEWGDNVLAHTRVPIPDDAVPSSGDDGKLVVVDRARDRVIDLWRAERTEDGWSAEWGGIYPLSGTGSSESSAYGDGPHHEEWPDPLSRGTGSGISSLAGLLRADELVEGEIDHALVFVTDRACGPPNAGPFRWPATTTDGWVTEGPCIEQGSRVQLDPSLDLESVPGITEVELLVGRALQEHGAYAVDIGGARMGVITEVARTPEQKAAYERLFGELGLVHPDYQALRRIPLDRTRVLASWDGS